MALVAPPGELLLAPTFIFALAGAISISAVPSTTGEGGGCIVECGATCAPAGRKLFS